MEFEGVSSAPSVPRPPRPMGVTAELAEARTKLRTAARSEHWDAILAEVSRLQREQSMSPLAALHAVHAKLASGWVPQLPR